MLISVRLAFYQDPIALPGGRLAILTLTKDTPYDAWVDPPPVPSCVAPS